MMGKKIAIIGGGLSGLYAAYLLEQQGIKDYVLFEVKEVLGGRISGFSLDNDINSFDLGPTWFWPDIQHQLHNLINQLSLDCFFQYEKGAMMVERHSLEEPIRMNGFSSSLPSMRIKGGMTSLIESIRSKLTPENIHTNKLVKTVQHKAQRTEICFSDTKNGSQHTIDVETILLAIPPRLAISTIKFIPSLPYQLTKAWVNTPTWMAGNAKYIAIYDYPFWRENGLSGDARSARGPMVEIHDASMPDGKYALFGFLGISGSTRLSIEDESLKAYCRSQLVRLFGQDAEKPIAEALKDWAKDPYTSTELDLEDMEHHQAPQINAKEGVWASKLMGIASEWSPQFPGYVAGAIEASTVGVSKAIELIRQRRKADEINV